GRGGGSASTARTPWRPRPSAARGAPTSPSAPRRRRGSGWCSRSGDRAPQRSCRRPPCEERDERVVELPVAGEAVAVARVAGRVREDRRADPGRRALERGQQAERLQREERGAAARG